MGKQHRPRQTATPEARAARRRGFRTSSSGDGTHADATSAEVSALAETIIARGKHLLDLAPWLDHAGEASPLDRAFHIQDLLQAGNDVGDALRELGACVGKMRP